MKRLLCIVSGMNTGGAETFLMKLYRAIDRTQYQIDFCVSSDQNYYQDEIEQLGGRVLSIPLKRKHPLKSLNAIRKLVNRGGYTSVMRINEHSLSTLDLIAARLGGAKRLIMRSSNASSGGGIKGALHYIFRPLTTLVPNVRIAPSKKAAEYTFGKRCVERGSVSIFPNGLDLKAFQFNEAERNRIRNALGLNNVTVIGHIGRFAKQKNQLFLVKVFKRIHSIYPNSILCFVGSGELEDLIEEQVRKLNLCGCVLFLGVRNDIPQLLSAFDILVLPSLYEGMPNVVIEAQANGLPCVVSDAVTSEANITSHLKYVSLDEDPDVWSQYIFRAVEEGRYDDGTAILHNAGYDISNEVNRFVDIAFR